MASQQTRKPALGGVICFGQRLTRYCTRSKSSDIVDGHKKVRDAVLNERYEDSFRVFQGWPATSFDGRKLCMVFPSGGRTGLWNQSTGWTGRVLLARYIKARNEQVHPVCTIC